MRKIIVLIAIAVLSVSVLGACVRGPAGDRVFALSSVEENDYGYTADSFNLFSINLFEDGTYRVDFQAKGMPVVAKESGTYTIDGSVLSLTKTDGSDLIDSIISYSKSTGEIKALCLNKNDGGTYPATFTQTQGSVDDDDDDENQTVPGSGFEDFAEGTYAISEVKESENNYTPASFVVFTVVFENGEYTATCRPVGAPLTLTEYGTYEITDGAMTLTKTSGNNVLAAAISYNSALGKVTLECKSMSGANYTAVFELVSN